VPETVVKAAEGYLIATWPRGASAERTDLIHALADYHRKTFREVYERLEEIASEGKQPTRGLAGAAEPNAFLKGKGH
jgi:hypothetical protein